MNKYTLSNNRIRAKEIRLVDADGTQLGVFKTSEGIKMAQEKGLDLVQVTEKVDPPVCKITDLGKYLYSQKKKDKKIKTKVTELKNVKLSFNISDNDLKTRIRTSEKFLNNKDKVRLELRLKGRERGLEQVGKDKMKKFLEILKEDGLEIKIEKELKKEPKGLTMIISKK